MNYGIVIFPSKEVQDRANNLRKRYDTKYNFIPPHITIKDAFEAEDLEEAIQHIEEVTKKIPPFQAKISKVKSFAPTTPVLYLAFEENEDLQKLHESINADKLYHETKFQYTPHITIGQDVSEQELHDVYSRLKLKDFKMDFLVDRIHLLYQIENGTWTNYQTFLLRGEK